jgi:hypothetical protein
VEGVLLRGLDSILVMVLNDVRCVLRDVTVVF